MSYVRAAKFMAELIIHQRRIILDTAGRYLCDVLQDL